MFPTELKAENLTLPESSDHKIIIITGSSLRHKRFAYRLQSEFGTEVIAWYEFTGEALMIQHVSKSQKLKKLIGNFKTKAAKEFRRGAYLRTFSSPFDILINKLRIQEFFKQYTIEEQRIFTKEIERLKKKAHLNPIKITRKDLKSTDFHASLKSHGAYFLLTLGGPLYPKEIIESVKGVCINQHAGHSPEYKGSFTTEWELYHRRVEFISSTVHITTPEADAGPILRRSQPSISVSDHAGTIFCKVVALGTELIIDVVKEIKDNKNIIVYHQPAIGKNFLAKEFNDDIVLSIHRDLKNGFLEQGMNRVRNY
jgi:folate-dependent phosphoribosylglycinamide formyltransferase PurN